MGKAGLILVALLGMSWYQLAGPGANGHSPRGSARALLRAAMSPDCANLIEERFLNTAGARSLCSPELARALRTRHQIIEESNDGYVALLECFYGST
jgi:hypothetical protein